MAEKTYVQRVYDQTAEKYSHEPEFLQAVKEFFDAIEPVVAEHPEYEENSILERLVEPERIISFRVPWVDDEGKVQVNTGYRVQYHSLNGPYKGGIRFHPSVNQSIMKFLGFEQTFKNSLTELPIGGGKGGADFDPRGKSNNEIMRFCQSFMTELSRYLGSSLDVPAGDIGVAGREVGYMYGQYKRLKGPEQGVFTGKPIPMGGSLGRTEATGHGVVYFLNEVLKEDGVSIKGQRVIVSGAGTVALYAARKVQELGGIVLSISDSKSAIYAKDGLDVATIDESLNPDDRATQYDTDKNPGVEKYDGSIYDVEFDADIVLPCATQNEIDLNRAKNIVKNGVKYVVEGANMPNSPEAIHEYKANGLRFGPGKAANAGGVGVSALEMSQNAMRLSWSKEKVDEELHKIMENIFKQCLDASTRYGFDHDYEKGANIASFENIAELMMLHGVI